MQRTRKCDVCGKIKPWKGGHQGPVRDGVRPFGCEDCCRASGGVKRWFGWELPPDFFRAPAEK